MKKLIVLSVLLAATPAPAVFHTAWHDAGQFTIKLSNYGMVGYENSGIWPKGTAESYIFGAGIWLAGLKRAGPACALTAGVDSTATTLAVGSTAGFDTTRGIIRLGAELVLYRHASPTSFDSCVRGFASSRRAAHPSGDSALAMRANVSIGYDPSAASSEFAPGDLPNEPGYTDTLDRILFSDNPRDTALWPLRRPGGAALVVSNEDSYNVSNDLDTSRHSGGGAPLGIKTIEIGYAWYYHYYEDFIFLTYLLINNSPTDTLKDLFTGLCCDADVGDATDDLVGSDQTRDLGFTWDSDLHEPGWGRTPGYVGYDFLESPLGPGGQLGLTAFKILRNPGEPGQGVPDPANDFEAFLTVAGYDHPTGRYHPVDSITEPTDVRFVQCTGPFTLLPRDTGRVVIAVIYGADTADLAGNSDLAQRLYDSGFITHRAWVDEPNGGEELSGQFLITWRDSSATGAPLLADIGCSRDRGKTWQDIATGVPSNGSYLWNTADYPDGTRYLVRVTVYDTIAVGEDLSDSVFTVNNPGNGAPDVELLAPLTGSVRGNTTVRWAAADPDHDTIVISLFLSPDRVRWETIATGLPNTGSCSWNTARHHNGLYYLKVQAADRDTFSWNISDAQIELVNDHPSAADIEHVQGGCNSLSVLALGYDPAAYTGHEYEITFEPIASGQPAGEPLYQYNLRDVTLDTMLLTSEDIPVIANGELFITYSPIIDGFALEFGCQVNKATFRYVGFHQVRNRSGFDGALEIYGADSLGTAPPVTGFQWCFRGSDYLVTWTRDDSVPDSLTLTVRDSTNRVDLPFGRNRTDCWHFGSGSRVSKYFNRTYHQVFYLDGGLFWFDRTRTMTVPPDTGDRWFIRAAGHRVPCQGNRYRFQTVVGVAEPPGTLRLHLGRVAPNPFRTRTVINLEVPAGRPAELAIYDASGRRVRVLAAGAGLSGVSAVQWDGADDAGRRLGAGIYFCRLATRTQESVKKLVLME